MESLEETIVYVNVFNSYISMLRNLSRSNLINKIEFDYERNNKPNNKLERSKIL